MRPNDIIFKRAVAEFTALARSTKVAITTMERVLLTYLPMAVRFGSKISVKSGDRTDRKGGELVHLVSAGRTIPLPRTKLLALFSNAKLLGIMRVSYK